MKMRWFDRALQLVSGFVMLALGMLLLLFSAGALRFETFSIEALFSEPWQWTPVFMAASVLLIALGLRLVFASFGAKKGTYYAVRSGDSDHVRISIQAIDHLTRKCLKRYTEIFLSHVNIEGQHDAIVIHLRMAVRSDVRIPELVSEIRSDVKDYIEECSGVKVERVEVMVEATKDIDRQDEPMPAPKPAPLLPPMPGTVIMPEDTAQPNAKTPFETPTPAEDWDDGEKETAPDATAALDVIVRDESVLSNEPKETAFDDGRDPLFFSNTDADVSPAPEAERLADSTEELSENGEMNAPGAYTPFAAREDELVSLDALEPEVEDQDVGYESDDQSGDQAWEVT